MALEGSLGVVMATSRAAGVSLFGYSRENSDLRVFTSYEFVLCVPCVSFGCGRLDGGGGPRDDATIPLVSKKGSP